jgi:hypothetical protein
MNIKSLEQMEEIVKKQKNLSWEGWDVIQTSPNPVAWRYPNGRFIKGKWYVQKRFPVTANGWELPNNVAR